MSEKNLVIVESPAKAKTIGKYLGPDYQVKACMGHLRDLPKSNIGVDIANDFEPDYKPIRGKEELIKDLQKSAKASETVFLATDPDREGEAISWHLQYLLNLDDEKAKRVTFNEITKKVVTESIQNPRSIDKNLVDAQQARRILDRVVGYQISPIMWKKIKRGLSAGRVQSVATRMVDDRDREISEFKAEEYWTLDVQLQNKDSQEFTAHYHGANGRKTELKSKEEVEALQEYIQQQKFTVTSVKQTDKQRSPSPPFTTSTMQQEASRKLNMTPRRTMAIAQQLYEGVDITGEGTVGLITYMRTDSLRISTDAQRDARDLISSRYGKGYCPEKVREYRTNASAQDAHEAIRPSNVFLTPEKIKGDLTGEQYRLYRLVWSRFLASQMSNAIYDNISTEINAGEHSFRASASNLKFSGYTAVYDDNREEDHEDKEPALPQLEAGEELNLMSSKKTQHFTQPPAHYTEATLIRAMEENGIGRPSTYAPTVSVILDRRYVVKEGKYLSITNLGHTVTGWMEKYFDNIAELKFTAQMEKELDEVEEGKMNWKDVLRGFYGGFEERQQQALEGDYARVEPTVSDELCPICGRNLVERDGPFGQFLGCPGYPECKFTMPIVVIMPGSCPICGNRILKRSGTSKAGNQYTYYCCENYNNPQNPDETCEFHTWDVPVKDDCPSCGHTMFKRSGRGFNRPYCINPACENFLPEEKRGYRKKAEDSAEKTVEEKKTSKAKAKAEEAATTEKKSAAKKSAKKTAVKKTTAKKPAVKKAAAKKTSTKKADKTTGEVKTTKKRSTKKSASEE